MTIPTQPIGSIPRPLELIEAARALKAGLVAESVVDDIYRDAVRDTVQRFEATGSPVITDGEQRKYDNFATYSIYGLPNLAPDGFKLEFAAGHHRQFPRLTAGPFRYRRYADSFLDETLKHAQRPVKQAVISPSALSLLYPAEAIAGYSREAFIEDLLNEHESEVRRCLLKGAHTVQIDFTEGRLAVKIDPSGHLLNSFIHLNNLALERLLPADRERLGVHTCPGADCDSTHSGEVDYAELLPSLFELKAGNFFIALAREPDRERVLRMIGRYLRPGQRAFIGVINVVSERVETPEEVRDLVLQAARHIPYDQLGTTDDCGYAPFSDDISTSRDTAFAKIRARVEGTALASAALSEGWN